MTRCKPVSFSRRTLLHGVSKEVVVVVVVVAVVLIALAMVFVTVTEVAFTF